MPLLLTVESASDELMYVELCADRHVRLVAYALQGDGVRLCGPNEPHPYLVVDQQYDVACLRPTPAVFAGTQLPRPDSGPGCPDVGWFAIVAQVATGPAPRLVFRAVDPGFTPAETWPGRIAYLGATGGPVLIETSLDAVALLHGPGSVWGANLPAGTVVVAESNPVIVCMRYAGEDCLGSMPDLPAAWRAQPPDAP